jgi:hypothetical protein
VGFVDGEGTFSVSINKNSTTVSGWQIFPEYVITQGAKAWKRLKKFSISLTAVNYMFTAAVIITESICIVIVSDLSPT